MAILNRNTVFINIQMKKFKILLIYNCLTSVCQDNFIDLVVFLCIESMWLILINTKGSKSMLQPIDHDRSMNSFEYQEIVMIDSKCMLYEENLFGPKMLIGITKKIKSINKNF